MDDVNEVNENIVNGVKRCSHSSLIGGIITMIIIIILNLRWEGSTRTQAIGLDRLYANNVEGSTNLFIFILRDVATEIVL